MRRGTGSAQSTATTENITALELGPFPTGERPKTVYDRRECRRHRQFGSDGNIVLIERTTGKWAVRRELGHRTRQAAGRAWTNRRRVSPGRSSAWSAPARRITRPCTRRAIAQLDRFRREWDKYFRGELRREERHGRHRRGPADEKPRSSSATPVEHALIAKALAQAADQLDGERARFRRCKVRSSNASADVDPTEPVRQDRYVVLNSGHTFHEADFKGTNALLYPRLGDFAVVKPTPTAKDPAAFEVITAGLFDEDWQFPKK